MEQQPEYTELYSRREKIKSAIIGVAVMAIVIPAANIYLFPWIRWFTTTAPCHSL